MVRHEPADDIFTEFHGLWIANGYSLSIIYCLHASHDELAFIIFRIRERLHGALPTRTYRTKRRMPTEVRQIEAQAKACLEKVSSRTDIELLIVNVYPRHIDSVESVKSCDCYDR